MTEVAADPKTATDGDVKKPNAPAAVTVSAEPPVCPETGVPCNYSSEPCPLTPTTGRVYCAKWVERIRADELDRRVR